MAGLHANEANITPRRTVAQKTAVDNRVFIMSKFFNDK